MGLQSLILHAPFKSKASSIARLVKNPPLMQETLVDSWVRKICWRRVRLPTPGFLGFPCGSDGKESTYNVEDLGSIPGLERSPGKGKGYPFQYSALENSKDTVHGVAKRIQSRGWQRIGHGWVTFTFTLREKHLFPTGLQLSSKQTLMAFKVMHLGTVSLEQDLRAGSPKWGSYLLPFGENLYTYAYPSICGLFMPTGHESLDYTVFFYWSRCGLFIFLVVESLIC